MMEPILSLSFSMHSNKGVYALLLGSGVSRSAGILTGWEIVLDLVRLVASLKSADCEPDPAAWYAKTFGKAPDYAELLGELAGSGSERSGLLRSYFEPTAAEREQGTKIPTEAHKAIAELVARGYVRVILTTNFDHLLEEALDAVGVRPTVIRTPDAVEGAVPLIHSNCTVVKLHGDYLDIRIKNTPEELAVYDPRINALLDRVFDEFGLVVCGWSAEWDKALWSALTRCKSRRFCTYWTVRSEPKDAAKRLIEFRGAQVIPTVGADAFFRQIRENVFGLESFGRPHPLSAKVAVANLERYIADDRHKILLHKLIAEETERVYERISGPDVPGRGTVPDAEKIPLRASYYETVLDTLLQLVIHGCYWGEKQHETLWTTAIERLANVDSGGEIYNDWIEMRRYPAMLLMYGGGIAALASSRLETLVGLLTRAHVTENEKELPMAVELCCSEVMKPDVGKTLPGKATRRTPVSEHVRDQLRPNIKGLVPREDQYDRLFDRFEYIVALVYADHSERAGWGYRVPVGRFVWKDRDYGRHVTAETGEEIVKLGAEWPLLKAGLFGGSLERLLEVKRGLDVYVARLPSR
ncbi:MAG: SIR2 family protein [Actinomycetota bacterium]